MPIPMGWRLPNIKFMCSSEHFMQFLRKQTISCVTWSPHYTHEYGGLWKQVLCTDLEFISVLSKIFLEKIKQLTPTCEGDKLENTFLCRSGHIM